MLLAQLESVAPAALRDFALIIGGLAGTAYYVKSLFWGEPKSAISPQPLIVALEKEFVSRKDFKEHVSAFNFHTSKCDNAHEVIGRRIAEVEKSSSSEIERHIEIVRKDLFEVGRYVTGLQTATKQQDQQLTRVEKTLVEMPEKIGNDINPVFRAIERTLGRLEGKIEKS